MQSSCFLQITWQRHVPTVTDKVKSYQYPVFIAEQRSGNKKIKNTISEKHN